MCFQMCGVDHDAFGTWTFTGQRGEDAVEHAEPAPADEAVVERLVRSVALWRIFPLQAMLDDETMPLITLRSSTRGTPCAKGKYGSIRAIWRSLSRNKSLITVSFQKP